MLSIRRRLEKLEQIRYQPTPSGELISLEEIEPEAAALLVVAGGDIEELLLGQLIILERELRRFTV